MRCLAALWVLVVWLPATLHCALEQWPGVGWSDCCGAARGEKSEPRSCDEPVCVVLENGLFKPQQRFEKSAASTAFFPAFVSDCWANEGWGMSFVHPLRADLEVLYLLKLRMVWAAGDPRAPSMVS